MRTGSFSGAAIIAGVCAALGAASGAQAYVVSIGGMADPVAGQVSARAGLTNANTENFDEYGSACNTVIPLGNNPQGTAGQFIISATSTRGVRNAPTGDSSCYASVGYGTGSFAFFNGVRNLSYFGLYLGSVDPYNQIQILGSDYKPLMFSAGTYTGTVLTGAILTSAFGLTTAQSVYLNFDFGASENAVQYLIQSIPDAAFEYDNLAGIVRTVTHSSQLRASVVVPEPGTLGVAAAGLLAFGIARRQRRRAQ